MKLLRAVSEAQAVGEFLKNEFYEAEYNRDREQFESLVIHPDYSNATENAVRRALLFRRRGHMWRELPQDTQWWQVEIEPEDLERIRVFPRAQWSKISDGSYCIGDIVRRIRDGHKGAGNEVTAKIQQMRYRLLHDAVHPSTILLIGVNEELPLTILEGNHRFAAAMLVSPEVAQTRFQMLCGFSPKMAESCWYETNVANLWRYLKNRLTHIVDDEADVARLLQPGGRPAIAATGGLVKAVAGEKLSEN
jgi:hypothetical protein